MHYNMSRNARALLLCRVADFCGKKNQKLMHHAKPSNTTLMVSICPNIWRVVGKLVLSAAYDNFGAKRLNLPLAMVWAATHSARIVRATTYSKFITTMTHSRESRSHQLSRATALGSNDESDQKLLLAKVSSSLLWSLQDLV
jgi:hypothetical protein